MQYYQSKDTNWELFFVLGSFKCVIWGMLKKNNNNKQVKNELFKND